MSVGTHIPIQCFLNRKRSGGLSPSPRTTASLGSASFSHVVILCFLSITKTAAGVFARLRLTSYDCRPPFYRRQQPLGRLRVVNPKSLYAHYIASIPLAALPNSPFAESVRFLSVGRGGAPVEPWQAL